MVYDVDPNTKRQWRYTDYGTHVIGHADGQIELDERFEGCRRGEVALLELKSMNDASFRKFQGKGVKSSHPTYYGQVQLMMGLSKINKSLFVCYNKNNSKYASELVPFDSTFYASQHARIQIAMTNEARKIASDETDWRCKGKAVPVLSSTFVGATKNPICFVHRANTQKPTKATFGIAPTMIVQHEKYVLITKLYHPRPKA